MSLEDGFYDRNARRITQKVWEMLFADTDYRLMDIVSLPDRSVELQWRGEKNGLAEKFPFAVVTHYARPAPHDEAGFDTLAEASAYWRGRAVQEGISFDATRGVTSGGMKKAPN